MTQGIRILPHSSNDYAMLPKRVRQISVKERECLDELGALLFEQGMQERFAISLLHRHFNYSDEELCFVTSNADRQSLTVSPVKRDELEGHSITAISCRFVQGDESAPLKMIGLEYAPISDLGEVAPISESDTACLEGLYRILVRNNAVNTFGVVLRHIDPRFIENLEWMENSDHSIRTSVRTLMPPLEIPKEDVSTSNWSWSNKSLLSASSCKGTEHFHCVSIQHCSSCDPKDAEEQNPSPEEPANQ